MLNKMIVENKRDIVKHKLVLKRVEINNGGQGNEAYEVKTRRSARLLKCRRAFNTVSLAKARKSISWQSQ
jgi:hypothetical protein